jgi:hypothetical protein
MLIFRPVLRVHDLTAEVLSPLEVRGVPGGVVVVPGGGEQHGAGGVELHAVARPFDRDGPACLLGGEVRAEHPVPEVDVPAEVVLVDRLLQVVQDLVAVGDRVVLGPRLEPEAERVQVGIRPDAGISEQVPRSADRVAAVDDGEGLARLPGRQVAAQADAGQAGADDQHVDVLEFRCHRSESAHLSSLPAPGVRGEVVWPPGKPGGYCGDIRDTRSGTTEMSGPVRPLRPGQW